MDRPKAFFASLFDFSFETFITQRVVKVLYGLSIAAAGLWALFLIVSGFRDSAGTGVLMLLIGGPLVFLVIVIYARVVLEVLLVIFRISEQTSRLSEDVAQVAERTGRLVEMSGRPPSAAPGPPPGPGEPPGY